MVDRLLARAISNVFARHVDIDELDEVVDAFESGCPSRPARRRRRASYVRWARESRGLDAVVESLGRRGRPAEVASAVEFVLEGLHLHTRLNKDRVGGGARYRR